MTVPVMESRGVSESIKMTVPVMDTSTSSGRRIVAFMMSSQYTLESLPKPTNANIRFRQVEPSRKAVLTYTLYATESRVEAKKNLLLSLLARDNLTTK